MILAIDIGNTNISFGLFEGKRLVKRYDIATKKAKYFQGLKKIFTRHKIDDAIICSVVPGVSKVLEKNLKRLLKGRLYCIGRNIKVPIKNLYDRPKEVGQDRLVNALAGARLYGAPLIVVDFGTAITFDVVSRRREYLGGMIIPGLKISLDALFQRTALLPKIRLGKPKEFIGKNTNNSMLSGIVYGFAALTDDLTHRIKEKIGRNALVIGTGGDVSLIGKYCNGLDKIDKDLTIKGLRLCLENLLQH